MSDIAIAGNLQEVLPFKAIGFLIYPIDELEKEDKRRSIIRTLLSNDHKIVFITEEYYNEVSEILESLKLSLKDRLPVIMPLTNGVDFKDTGRLQLKNLVERAIGIDIFKEH
ncbi:MAG: hypothetical protein KKH98_00025 [Spirochaetes bacterium]|nr:hypothetical protein [Spirochaetota bacterium]